MLGEFDFSDEKLQDTTGVLPPKKQAKIIPENWFRSQQYSYLRGQFVQGPQELMLNSLYETWILNSGGIVLQIELVYYGIQIT